MDAMGFQEAKRKALTALQDGKVAYETREAQEKKNLLATGAITFAEAASIIGLTRGHQASCSPIMWTSSLKSGSSVRLTGTSNSTSWTTASSYRSIRWVRDEIDSSAGSGHESDQ